MSVMKELATRIEEDSQQDKKVESLMNWIVNQHIQGKYELSELPLEAQHVIMEWEDDVNRDQDMDKWAKEVNAQRKRDVHANINFAVKNGQLDYDTAMELVNDPDKAEEWMEKGVI